ncbi:lytic transglycosylase domain-containing protein [Miltoncostaea marina]|uniref:lytic transglycosylase domain-containing protein n=1 Tax=Miltoncostaea marina TaxID=2843215 RepID=UPI001C3C6E7B|nr:lytic transglycosylase domain-containing protein [Miltoncostaea marina]
MSERLAEGRGAVAPRPPARHGAPAPRAARGRSPRRRLALALVLLAVVGGGLAAWHQVHSAMPAWYARLWYPLEYEEAIREEAARNGLDPALVAAVINTESGFAPDSRSSQGAVGLMQLLPATAEFVARQPRRPSPPPDRLLDPEVNVAYGTRYLRYLVDRHGTVPLALAAYNGGETNLADWLDRAASRGGSLRIPEDIPFSETRAFVGRVLEAAPIYRRAYGERLGGG